MKILIDIGHPGHVHLFRPFAQEMISKGHDLLFTCRQKEFEIELLEAANFKYVSFGKHYKTKLGKLWGLVKFDFQMFLTALKFKPNVFLSAGSMYAAQVSFLFRKPHILFEDTGNMEQIRFYLPFTEVIFSPEKLERELGVKQLRYSSFHEIAYLAPKYFTPDKNIFEYLGLKEGEKYVILRFVSWNATHDVGQGGFSAEEKDELVSYLASKYTLFISSEAELPEKYRKYLFKLSPDKIHHAMAFAALVISEGATMASESGVLGVPAIYVNSLRGCNNEDLEDYGLVSNFRSGKGVLEKAKEIQALLDNNHDFSKNRAQFLENKIDITELLIWFVENYPKSRETLMNDKDYQKKFKLI